MWPSTLTWPTPSLFMVWPVGCGCCTHCPNDLKLGQYLVTNIRIVNGESLAPKPKPLPRNLVEVCAGHGRHIGPMPLHDPESQFYCIELLFLPYLFQISCKTSGTNRFVRG
jgi:hypothetical protein